MYSTSSLNPREMEPLVHLQHLYESTFLFLSTLHTHTTAYGMFIGLAIVIEEVVYNRGLRYQFFRYRYDTDTV